MRATAKSVEWSEISNNGRRFITPESQLFLTPGRSYEIYALSLYESVLFFLIFDDLQTPVFRLSELFSVIEKKIPENWICNTNLGEGLDLVVGPDFIARDAASYNAMVDQEIHSVDLLWLERKKRNVIDSEPHGR